MSESKHQVPGTFEERTRLRGLVQEEVALRSVTPPLSLTTLQKWSQSLLERWHLPAAYQGWLMVELHNQAWLPFFSSVPYERRLLLLPQCFRNSSRCEADVDEIGLLCHHCGRCVIPNLEDDAASLGMMTLVAEGFTSVVELIRNGMIDCVIGVSCLDSLEKAFPLLIGNAVPGIAIPLNYDGCKDTQVDDSYVRQLMSSRNDEDAFLLDYSQLREEVNTWFSRDSLSSLMGQGGDQTSMIALDWMAEAGKRWRPYLVAAVYCALRSDDHPSDDVRKAAIGVECFHKASLVHDDIQDDDDERYGKPTVHVLHGVPMAINVGDALLGEGYHLLASCSDRRLLMAVTEAHLSLCKGQGMELAWDGSAPTMDFVIDIFRLKTVPAFEVSLLLGLICAGDDEVLRDVFHRYAEALGIAYQLQDDLSDFHGMDERSDTEDRINQKPSAVVAAWMMQDETVPDKERMLKARQMVSDMARHYHDKAIAVLEEIHHTELKRLLFRITDKILK